jgi:hypothetical protein
MFNDILDRLNKNTSIRERLVALKETKSLEQVALAPYKTYQHRTPRGLAAKDYAGVK